MDHNSQRKLEMFGHSSSSTRRCSHRYHNEETRHRDEYGVQRGDNSADHWDIKHKLQYELRT